MFASTRLESSADLVTIDAPPTTTDSLAELIISNMCNLSSSKTKAVSRARLDSHGTGTCLQNEAIAGGQRNLKKQFSIACASETWKERACPESGDGSDPKVAKVEGRPKAAEVITKRIN
jgi:hypothetical protein